MDQHSLYNETVMSDLVKLQQKIIQFRDEREWQQFHNPKDCALSLVLEAAELLEHFQWKNDKALEEYTRKHKDEIADELADVLYWTLLMSHDLGIDLAQHSAKKLAQTAKKYPVHKSKGRHSKYTDL